jgi:glycosyltransferase involved in cell wall biosynthesis
MRLRPEMRLFASHRIRGAIRFGPWVVFGSPAIWINFFGGAARLVLRKAGATGPLVTDRPAAYAVATPWLPADFAFLRRVMPQSLQAIIADYIYCTPAFGCASAGVRKAIVMHDLFHSRSGGGADSVSVPTREGEIALLSEADTVFTIQQTEQDFVTQSVPNTDAILAPMPANPISAVQPGSDNEILFVGSNTAPNVVGLNWFLDHVWPRVLAARPQARLTVAGTVDRAFAGVAVPNVSMLGMVDDLEPLYSKSGLLISPLTFGSGLKIKLIEALAQGKAMVVTPVTLQGVEDLCRGSVIETDDPAVFAASVTGLLADVERRTALARQALDCADRNFSAARVHAELRAWGQAILG